ncbi:Photosynthetic apparatus regulatory protein RegA (plasmid) [Asticcacaulis sp. MM231]|uniref:response regulator transcription factor n=1 Tax=Asticcacaulis sp. MM231 TaxID=3157666 RepID=UPI0032D59154
MPTDKPKAIPQKPSRVLIVDDDQVLAETLRRSFERRHFDARVAHGTDTALAEAETFLPDYAVVDLRMLGPSGLECVKGLNALNPTMKIVVLTGYASITTAVAAVKLGACHYLAKPANLEDILAAFEKADGETDIPITDKKSSLKTVEWERINEVLVQSNYNISETARRLNMHRRTLARKLAKRPMT